jgi:hypothetical protein
MAMLRFARFAAAVISFPFVWALCRTFVDAICLSSGNSGAFFSYESVALFSGLAAFPVLWKFLPDQTRLYVLGHELTHAVWGLAFGAKVSGIKVRSSGGSVMLSKSNVWISLAPYFFPFWTAVVALFALAVKGVMYLAYPGEPFPLPWLWMFAVGFTWSFHACFTIRSLMQTQPDVEEYGKVFSWTFILVCNIAGVIVWIVCATDVPASAVAGQLLSHSADAYRSSCNMISSTADLAVDGIKSALCR